MKLPLIQAATLALLAPLVSAQEIKLLASDGASDDFLGGSVAAYGDKVIIGADGDDDNGPRSGSAYIFNATTGEQLAKLVPSDGASLDYFGFSVAISDTTAVIGARHDDDNGFDSGSAYLFNLTTGSQIAKLLSIDGTDHDHFGYSVAISGNTVIVGADGDDDNGEGSGSAYLFDATTGAQLAKLLPNDGAPDDYFGLSVAISGTTAIVGANCDDDNGESSGAAYLFDTTTGAQIAKLTASDAAGYDHFGTSVAISGSTAIVGAYDDDDNGSASGAAYLFDTTTATQIAKLLPSDGASNDYFGLSVAISGNNALVGAERDDVNGADSGSAYLFDTTTGAELAKFSPGDSATGDFYGNSVGLSGATAILGAWGADSNGANAGSAYLFRHGCDVANYCIASPNTVSATGAPISLDGLPSLSTNNMALRADNLRPNQFGVFFYGPVKQDPPVSFGDGYRCVGTFDLKRLNPPVATGTGTAQRALDMTAAPLNSVQAGDTRYFQFWYRDPGVIGAGYNLTDGLEITFCP